MFSGEGQDILENGGDLKGFLNENSSKGGRFSFLYLSYI